MQEAKELPKGAVINFAKRHGKKTNTFWFDTINTDTCTYLVFINRRTRERSFMFHDGSAWKKGIGMVGRDSTIPEVYPYDLPEPSPVFFHHDTRV